MDYKNQLHSIQVKPIPNANKQFIQISITNKLHSANHDDPFSELIQIIKYVLMLM